MFYSDGTFVQTSTQTEVTNPTTASLIAEITGLTQNNYEARVICGATTNATFLVEQCLSSALASTSLRESSGYLGIRTIYSPTQQSGQYMVRFTAESGDRVRVRVGTAITGLASATIQLEKMT